jgi:uncharacterized protein (TIGR01777 family)
MSQTVLIAGGSGLIGDELSIQLLSMGYEVRILGRGTAADGKVQHFNWNPAAQLIDENCLTGVDFVINLAGANVGKGKWTKSRKKILLNSRIDSTTLLAKTIIDKKIPIRKFIQASAIGFYGFTNTGRTFTETDSAGTDFLATLTQQWENTTEVLIKANIPLNILRIGVVLSPKGGALLEMCRPIKLFAGSFLGSGKQIVPWIHVKDMVSVFIKSIKENEFLGIYNCVAPEPVTNKELTKEMGKALHRPIWPLGVPAFILRMLLGEQAQIVLEGNAVSCKKLIDSGFVFQYPTITKAIGSLLAR